MRYPTIDEVERASHEQLCRWHRFLPSPGSWAVGKRNFEEVLEHEAVVMNLIEARFNDMGGMTPEISKRIGL